jgi:hypothetical protein
VILDKSSLNARLPHGIQKIKKHIKEVDSVPLKVSLFCDSTPTTTKNMIQILQDNNEIVLAGFYFFKNKVGSSTGTQNSPIFCNLKKN